MADSSMCAGNVRRCAPRAVLRGRLRLQEPPCQRVGMVEISANGKVGPSIRNRRLRPRFLTQDIRREGWLAMSEPSVRVSEPKVSRMVDQTGIEPVTS